MKDEELKSLLKHKPGYRELFRSFPMIVGLILEADRASFLKIVGYASLQTPAAWARLYAIKLITDGILGHSVRDFILAMVILGAVGLMDDFTGARHQHHIDLMRYGFERYLNLRSMRHVASLPMATLEDPRFRELSQAFREKRHVAFNIVEIFAQLPGVLFSFLGLTTAAMYVPWFVVLLLGLSVVLRFALMSRVPHFNWSVLNYETRQGRMALAFQHYMSSIKLLMQSKILGLAGYFTKRWNKAFLEIQAEKIKAVEASTKANFWSELVRNIGNLVGLGYVGWQVLGGRAAFSAFTVFMTAYSSISNTAARTAFMLARLQKEWMFIPLFQRFFALMPQSEIGQDVPSGELVIEFKRVWFRYPGRTAYVLRGVELKLRAGERIALTGINGAGKTTLINLLLGIYKPSQGQILVNGVDLNTIRPSAWFQAVSYIPQDARQFEDQLDELIRQGWVDEELDRELLHESAQAVHFDRVVEKLDKGWSTHCGREWATEDDGGHELSGGQEKQLIITRQMYRARKTRACIFDEGAANLDPERRTAFYRNTSSLAGKLVIHATHDAEALKYVDRVVELPSPELDRSEEQAIVSLDTSKLN